MAFTEYYLNLTLGAASGNNGTSEALAWGTFAEAQTGIQSAFGGATATHAARVNVKGSQSITTTSVTLSTNGTAAFPIAWRGYVTTIGDCDDDPTLARPTLTQTTGGFTLSGTYNNLSSLRIEGARTAGAQVTLGSNGG